MKNLMFVLNIHITLAGDVATPTDARALQGLIGLCRNSKFPSIHKVYQDNIKTKNDCSFASFSVRAFETKRKKV